MRFLLLISTVFLCIACSSPDVAGSGSNAGNPYIITVAKPSGEKADSAGIFIRSEHYVADSVTSSRIPDHFTDSDGNATISFPDNGIYIVELTHGRNYSKQISSETIKAVNRFEENPIHLESTASISGKIESALAGGLPLYVQLKGFEHTVPVMSDGTFHFEQVPAGDHRYTITAGDSTYSHDSIITIAPDENVDMGTIELSDSMILSLALNEMGLDTVSLDDIANFRHNGHISVLDIRNFGIENLSPKLAELSPSIFKVGGNPIGSLPEWMMTMESITELVLSECNLTELPDNIGDLVNLEKLFMANNRISSIPYSLAEMDSLLVDVNGNALVNVDHETEEWLEKTSIYSDWKSSQYE